MWEKNFIKNSISKDVFLDEIYQNGISNIKEVEPAPRTLQNYYVSDPQIKLKKSDQAVLSSTIGMHHIPTVVINGIPFHNFHKVNILSDSSILNAENGPIYETLDDDFYCEISNTKSDRGEVGPISYQAATFYLEEGRTSEVTDFKAAQCIPPRRCIPSTQDSYLNTGQRT